MLFGAIIVATLGVAYADETQEEAIVTLQEGDVAPFSGTLFSTTASAKLAVDLENAQKTCQLKIDQAVETKESEMQYLVDVEKVKLEFCEKRSEEILIIKNDHIDLLNTQIKRRGSPSASAWYVGGIVTGILATSFGVWAVSQASAN